MAHRIIAMREQLYDLLTNEFKTPGKWNHIVDQIGMFSCVPSSSLRPLSHALRKKIECYLDLDRFTGLNAEQCKALVEKAHIYLTGNGRISMAGLNSKNIRYFAESVDRAVRGTL
jgi:aspartate aminotransferase